MAIVVHPNKLLSAPARHVVVRCANGFKTYGKKPQNDDDCVVMSLPELRKICNDLMIECDGIKSASLSAPQIGAPARVFVMKIDKVYRVFVNPRVVMGTSKRSVVSSASAEARQFMSTEACPSLPNHRPVAVMRCSECEVMACDLTGLPFSLRVSGIRAVCAQHEFDHLNGITLLDKIPKSVERAARRS